MSRPEDDKNASFATYACNLTGRPGARTILNSLEVFFVNVAVKQLKQLNLNRLVLSYIKVLVGLKK